MLRRCFVRLLPVRLSSFGPLLYLDGNLSRFWGQADFQEFSNVEKTLHSEESRILTDHLRQLRSNAGMTVRELASAVGTQPSRIGKIEQGERRLDVVEYFKLVTALGRDPEIEASRLMKLLKTPHEPEEKL